MGVNLRPSNLSDLMTTEIIRPMWLSPPGPVRRGYQTSDNELLPQALHYTVLHTAFFPTGIYMWLFNCKTTSKSGLSSLDGNKWVSAHVIDTPTCHHS